MTGIKDLVKQLKERFPDAIPRNPVENVAEINVKVGNQQVIRVIEALVAAETSKTRETIGGE